MEYNFEKLNILEQFGDFSNITKTEFLDSNSGGTGKDNSTTVVVIIIIILSIVAYGIYEKNKEETNKKFEKRK